MGAELASPHPQLLGPLAGVSEWTAGLPIQASAAGMGDGGGRGPGTAHLRAQSLQDAGASPAPLAHRHPGLGQRHSSKTLGQDGRHASDQLAGVHGPGDWTWTGRGTGRAGALGGLHKEARASEGPWRTNRRVSATKIPSGQHRQPPEGRGHKAFGKFPRLARWAQSQAGGRGHDALTGPGALQKGNEAGTLTHLAPILGGPAGQ